ncbi:hypothetical protein C2845_PM01G21910 [Panicum miliaceum]|uniref:Peptidase C1A papain C-terminal domain-containing protein n=1 Tax=Panicum miliaceum TaxID=4540 RepID=A0A3L6TP83_PANMI|nr:hypothetical protein C2845_PM01G21910 [Panicum miliaceum]
MLSALSSGDAVSAFQYVSKNSLASSVSYPYRGVNGTCYASTTLRMDLIIVKGFEEMERDYEGGRLTIRTITGCYYSDSYVLKNSYGDDWGTRAT